MLALPLLLLLGLWLSEELRWLPLLAVGLAWAAVRTPVHVVAWMLGRAERPTSGQLESLALAWGMIAFFYLAN
jgi:hypothetical protein